MNDNYRETSGPPPPPATMQGLGVPVASSNNSAAMMGGYQQNMAFNPTLIQSSQQHPQHHTILPFGPSANLPPQSFPSSLVPPFPSIQTSIPPSHFLSGSGSPSPSHGGYPSQNFTQDKNKRKRQSRSNEDEDDEDDLNSRIEIDEREDDRSSASGASASKSQELKKRKGSISTVSSTGSSASQKGCSCKKTGCLKRYCECFQNNKRCTDKCRCQGCKNYDCCPDLIKVLEKQSKTGTSTSQRKGQNVQKRKNVNPVSVTANNRTSTHMGSPSILGGGAMAQPVVTQFQPTPTSISQYLHHHPLSCIYGEESVVELCKRLVLAAVHTPTSPTASVTTPQKPKPGQPSDNFLLCDEDDVIDKPSSQSGPATLSSPTNRRVVSKGYENALQTSLAQRITHEFKMFLNGQLSSLQQQPSNSFTHQGEQ